MTEALRRSFTSLEIPNYRRFFGGQLVSLSGNWMQMVGEIWLILALTGSGVAVGVTTALQFLPILLFGAWGGALADRFDKRSLLLVTQALMVVPALALWALTAGGSIEPWMVYGLVFARGAVNSVDSPARHSFVIEIVGTDRVVSAVGLNSVLIHCARIIGPALAGVAIATVGVATCFLLNAVSFAAMLVALRGMNRGALEPADRDPDGERGVRAAVAYVLRHARPGDPPGDDGPRRHAGLQLPGRAAAARAVLVRRRGRRLHRARGRDGPRLGGRRRRHGRPQPGQPGAADRRRRAPSARWRPSPPRRPPSTSRPWPWCRSGRRP